MKNRIPDDLLSLKPRSPRAQRAIDEPLELGRKAIAVRMGRVTSCVRDYPAAAITAAVCIGILLGWAIKRK